jgi:hypothetical protein
VSLGPAEVHPELHLGPVRGLGAAGARADREHGVLGVVLAREQEQRPLARELPPEGIRLAREVSLRLGVGGVDEEVDELLEVLGALLQRAPQADLLAQALGLADDLLRGALVVPEPGLDGAGVELRYAAFLGGEVKDAPRSTGSARRGPGWPARPLRAHLGFLEQDRTELDEPQGGLAPGDDGVHAGAVRVVGTHAAVAITVEGGGVAAGPAVPFACDQIDELGFLSLLHNPSLLRLPLSDDVTVGTRAPM